MNERDDAFEADMRKIQLAQLRADIGEDQEEVFREAYGNDWDMEEEWDMNQEENLEEEWV